MIDRTALDPTRVESAMRRAKAALAVAKHHEAQAKKEKAKAWQLARTWGFYIVDDAVATELPTDPLDFRG